MFVAVPAALAAYAHTALLIIACRNAIYTVLVHAYLLLGAELVAACIALGNAGSTKATVTAADALQIDANLCGRTFSAPTPATAITGHFAPIIKQAATLVERVSACCLASRATLWLAVKRQAALLLLRTTAAPIRC